MIQDIAPKKFYNPIRFDTIAAKDKVVLFDERSVLIQRNDQNELIIPSFYELKRAKERKVSICFFNRSNPLFYQKSRIYAGKKEQVEGYGYEALSTIRQLISKKEICFAVMSAWHLAWDGIAITAFAEDVQHRQFIVRKNECYIVLTAVI